MDDTIQDVPPEKLRFQLELEFVQCLANPAYLQYLAQQRYFENPAFINYLSYLKYWQKPAYAKYIQFPYSLSILDLLQHESFRKACASADTAAFLHKKQYYHWEAYRARSWAKTSNADLKAQAGLTHSPTETSIISPSQSNMK
ncbi:hypothetical protein BASA50_004333 [Batrachochytrium salamandrivorans]|uniref:Mediator of RNA polymerase II transcription subunit 31 n=1 Tax=Batrachochytrium salamandrivorans TaxID=1357716 RepID=A0ABQ8FJ04_9FUNG|nr:hypothetical protein BASA62_001016 [Batrachochytrium salamandrivorans]KAH6578958.1 hypothetical protein BASA60_003444 [Batrachochytrium salamandrivorans]KAH6597728.1 hypothetical protein BASA50_004333 [Batrachochytrium salamandrivorans]KAH6601979.1 hypothetical protein BASA61_001577 [Batrachochytrium salamandrivorans]KAH9264687.1 hypothetical protein BASA83_011790 [Batrachochytrium salamandrivorans]